MHVPKSEVRAGELVFGSIAAILVKSRCVCVSKPQNTNCVISGISHTSEMLLCLYLKLHGITSTGVIKYMLLI